MPKIVDHGQYRKELLMKSFDLIAEKGYNSITMRQLAKGLGVSTGTLYHYFPSKEALFLQLVEELTQQDILNFLAEAGNPPSLTERIEILFNFIAKNEDYFGKQTRLWIEFYQQDCTEFLNNETLKQADEQSIQAIADYLQISDRAIIDFVLNLLYGLVLRRMFGDETVSFTEQRTLLSKMLTAYLKLSKSSDENYAY
jgi:AcrR family transcriptional regulator